MSQIKIKTVVMNGCVHYEAYDFFGKFIVSADTYNEIWDEIYSRFSNNS